MGRSAKLHKRVSKKPKVPGGAGGSSSSAAATSSTQSQTVQTAKKKSTLKAKASSSKASKDGVLGGADYVSLMMGSRKKAREEAKKLPRDDS